MDEQQRLSQAYSSLKEMYDKQKAAIVLRDQKIAKLEFRVGELKSEVAELKDENHLAKIMTQLATAKDQIKQLKSRIENVPSFKKKAQRLASDIICISVYATERKIAIPEAYLAAARGVIDFLEKDVKSRLNDTGTE